MRVHYLVKLQIRVFVKIYNTGKAKLNKFYLLAIIVAKFYQNKHFGT